MGTFDKLIKEKSEFSEFEEEAIISLAIDHPEFFTSVGRFMKPEMFTRNECRYIIAHILNCYESYSVIPTRDILLDKITSELDTSSDYKIILDIVNKKSNPREVPIVKDSLLKWAKIKAFGLLYSEESIEAYHRGDYSKLEEVVNTANRIADVGSKGFWFLENYKFLLEPSSVEHRTTGFPKLDKILNNGGPSPKEVVCWLAPTNSGKSMLLCNNAIASLKGMGAEGSIGQNVLLVTFELDTVKTALRCLGITTAVPVNAVSDHKEHIERIMENMKATYNKRLLIYEYPPDECSVNHIYSLIDNTKRMEGWKPDVIILDYLDLMVSRHDAYNSDDYTRQKHVATEVRGLAKNENVLIFTATQTNRAGASTGSESIDMTKAAESFGKQFPLDYVISLNQSDAEARQKPAQLRMFVAKNRNGPKNQTVECTIEYDKMLVKEKL